MASKLSAPFPRRGMSLGYGAYDGGTYTKSNPHRGQDWSSARLGSYGLPIRASGAGVVRFNGVSRTSGPVEGHPSSAHGNSIAVYYPSRGITVHYSHRRKADGPGVGALVDLGTVIGNVGNTGLSTGEHLHMDVWRNGVRVDPAIYFDFDTTVDAQTSGGGVTPFPVIPTTSKEWDEMASEEAIRKIFREELLKLLRDQGAYTRSVITLDNGDTAHFITSNLTGIRLHIADDGDVGRFERYEQRDPKPKLVEADLWQLETRYFRKINAPLMQSVDPVLLATALRPLLDTTPDDFDEAAFAESLKDVLGDSVAAALAKRLAS